MAILLDGAIQAASQATTTQQIASEHYMDADPQGPPAIPPPKPILDARRSKGRKSYYDRFIEAFARETTSDVRRKIFGTDPLK
jgi:hypothetical protein